MGQLEADIQELHDDVEDRARGQREERHLERLVHPRLADERAQERRTSGDEAHHSEEAPAGPVRLRAQGTDDPEPFGGVVETEADDKEQRELDRVAGGRLPDGEALGEVVQADADGDEQCQALRLGQSVDPR